jgi:hypothetical protein
MAFKAINNSAGLNSLVLTLLVFRAYPKIIESDTPSSTVAQRAITIKKAMAEIYKLQAERQITDTLNTRNRPITNKVHNLSSSLLVLV